jgi:hypothetical protein
MLQYVVPIILGLLLAALLLFGCSAPDQSVTFYRDVQPIVEAKCQGCHVTNGIAPFPLVSYEDVRDRQAMVVSAIHSREMPPWPPGPGSLPLRFNRSVSDEQESTINAWVRQGMEKGDPRDSKPPVEDKVEVRPDLTLTMPAPYSPSLQAEDDYRCYVLDPRLESDRYVTGYDIKPGVAAMVHHVNLYLVTDPESIDELEEKEHEDTQPGYSCLGGPGGKADSTSRILGGWEPGTQAVQFPLGTAIRLPRGARVVLLMHYTTMNVHAADQTSVDFELGEQPDKEASILELRNDSFTVPIGKKDYAVEREQEIDGEFAASAIYSAFPHMHFYGTSVSVSVRRRSGAETTILDIPEWRYHWQGMYFLQQPLAVQAGDQLRLKCTYDNTVEHQLTISGNASDLHELHWGNRAVDEMCLVYLYVTGSPTIK